MPDGRSRRPRIRRPAMIMTTAPDDVPGQVIAVPAAEGRADVDELAFGRLRQRHPEGQRLHADLRAGHLRQVPDPGGAVAGQALAQAPGPSILQPAPVAPATRTTGGGPPRGPNVST